MSPGRPVPLLTYEDRLAAAALQTAIESCHEFGIEPAQIASIVHREILGIYGVETSSPLPLILRALEAWKPSTRLVPAPGVLGIVSTECPLADRAARDPAACTACKLVQGELLARGLGSARQGVRFERTLVEGGASCEARVDLGRETTT